MNFATFERGYIASFAYCEARYTGSLDCMKAVCFVLRNRVKAGWGDGSWISVVRAAHEVSGIGIEFRPPAESQELYASSDRLLQLIVRDIDDIYLGQDRMDDSTRMVVCGDNPPKTAALYYTFVDRPLRPWFADNIIRKPQEHKHIGNVGPMMLFQ